MIRSGSGAATTAILYSVEETIRKKKKSKIEETIHNINIYSTIFPINPFSLLFPFVILSILLTDVMASSSSAASSGGSTVQLQDLDLQQLQSVKQQLEDVTMLLLSLLLQSTYGMI
jgi:hypothetical protein